jgi:MYXO-CTERM domain-containing protein
VNGAVMTGTTAQQFDISFFTGRRSGNTAVGSFTVLLQAYNGSTFVGNLASQSYYAGTNDSNANTIDLNLGVGDWTNSAITLSLTAPANLLPGNNIRLIFAQNAPFGTNPLTGEMAIDNVSIVAVPEPGFALLGGLGLLGLLRRRR